MGVQSSFDVQDMGVKHNTYRHFLCSARECGWVVNRAKVTLLSRCVGTEQPGTPSCTHCRWQSGHWVHVVCHEQHFGDVKGHGCTCVTAPVLPPAAPPLSPGRTQISSSCGDEGAVKWDGMFFPPRHRNLESSGCKNLPGMPLAVQQSRCDISRFWFPGVAGQEVAAGGPPAPHYPGKF